MLVLPSASVDDLLDWEAVQPLQLHGFVYLTPLMMYVPDRVLHPEKQDNAWHSPKGSGMDLSGSTLPKCLAADKISLHCLSRLSKHTFRRLPCTSCPPACRGRRADAGVAAACLLQVAAVTAVRQTVPAALNMHALSQQASALEHCL